MLTATLDLSAAAPNAVFKGYARLRLDGSAPGTSGEEGRLEYSLGAGPNLHAEPGAPMRAVSPVIPIECVATACDVPIDVFVLPEGIHLPADVDLPLEIEFTTLDGGSIPDGATIDYRFAPNVPVEMTTHVLARQRRRTGRP